MSVMEDASSAHTCTAMLYDSFKKIYLYINHTPFGKDVVTSHSPSFFKGPHYDFQTRHECTQNEWHLIIDLQVTFSGLTKSRPMDDIWPMLLAESNLGSTQGKHEKTCSRPNTASLG